MDTSFPYRTWVIEDRMQYQGSGLAIVQQQAGSLLVGRGDSISYVHIYLLGGRQLWFGAC